MEAGPLVRHNSLKRKTNSWRALIYGDNRATARLNRALQCALKCRVVSSSAAAQHLRDLLFFSLVWGIPMKQLRLILGKAYTEVSPVLPARLSGLLDWHLLPSTRNGFSGPFNGQIGRIEIFRQVMACVRFNAIVETGTFRGTTTEFLHDVSSLPVYTVEATPRLFYYSKRRFRHVSGIHPEFGDSRTFLKNLAATPGMPCDRVFFYLDAHWNADLPLAEELEIIARSWSDPVIMIDDFEVPDDPGYKFDDYGPGKRLSVALLPDGITSGFRLFWPAIRAQQESGWRRGCVVAARRDRAGSELAKLPVLREITWGSVSCR